MIYFALFNQIPRILSQMENYKIRFISQIRNDVTDSGRAGKDPVMSFTNFTVH